MQVVDLMLNANESYLEKRTNFST